MRPHFWIVLGAVVVAALVAFLLLSKGDGGGGGTGAAGEDLARMPADAAGIFAVNAKAVVNAETAALIDGLMDENPSAKPLKEAGFSVGRIESVAGAWWPGNKMAAVLHGDFESAKIIAAIAKAEGLSPEDAAGKATLKLRDRSVVAVGPKAIAVGDPEGVAKLVKALGGEGAGPKDPEAWLAKVDESAEIVAAGTLEGSPFAGFALSVSLGSSLETRTFLPGDAAALDRVKAVLGMAKLGARKQLNDNLEAMAKGAPEMAEQAKEAAAAAIALVESANAEAVEGGVLVTAEAEVDAAQAIAQLTTVSTVAFQRYMRRAKEMENAYMMRKLHQALQVSYAETGAWPKDLKALQGVRADALVDVYGSPFILDTSGGVPTICSAGPDRVSGTEDDDCTK